MHPEKNRDQRQQGEKKKTYTPETLSEHNKKKLIRKKLRCEVSI